MENFINVQNEPNRRTHVIKIYDAFGSCGLFAGWEGLVGSAPVSSGESHAAVE
jgi:hypothetical protein